MIDELSALRLIEERFHKASKCVEVGIGDDAAAVRISPGNLLLATTDCQVEDVHFVKSLISLRDLARKSVAVAVSDIGAMGGVPKFILASLGFPKTEGDEFIDEMINGFRASEEEFGVSLIGGNLSSSDKLFLDVTALGEVEPVNIVKRSGAEPDDVIYVSGTLGDSALGLKILRSGNGRGRDDYLIQRHVFPEPRLALGRRLAESGLVTSMIDVSDGLMLDLERITLHQGVGARVELERIPTSTEYDEKITGYAQDTYELALGGGEDYELLFTSRPEKRGEIGAVSRSTGIRITEIGSVVHGDAVRVLDTSGDEITVNMRGFVHFNN